MSDLALRPRSATELVDAAFQLYRRNPVPFITGMALIYVPWMVIIATTGVMAAMTDPTAFRTLSPAVWTFALGGILVYLIATSVSTLLAKEAYFGREPDLTAAFRAMIPRLWSVFVATAIFFCALVISFPFLFIPGFYVYGRLFANKQAVLFEDHGGIRAIGRSWQLSKGQVLHVLGTMTLAIILAFAISIGAQILSTILPGQTIRVLVSTAISCVIYPMISLIETLLYYDIRIRREGFDIEYLAAMAPTSTQAPSTAT